MSNLFKSFTAKIRKKKKIKVKDFLLLFGKLFYFIGKKQRIKKAASHARQILYETN